MAKHKKRPVIPIYAIAVVWIIFTLVHPLYRVSDYVTVILLSAVVFIVAKGIFPTVEYELPDPPKEEEKPAQEEPAEDPQNAILEEIRAINADIDNPKLNQQIDRIGVITAKVFEYQRSHPQKSNQLHSFLSYYLPTTLKILRAYAQLEDQEVDGENISAAMERIEGMMDKVVEGFEKQLDQLFQGDALDITADVEVLERMLAKDGLSSGSTLRMGG